ncbi:hypothetical protein N7491_007788 [Penicillium cf. griseofulvum]|uniref:Uncharacterized protein n=1 Tax=Penicillium cf. griseofulvum TaxID=2972120 RepID=A0A9W9M0Q4_9EURO|nr:hypothetical protein N7472_009184 [Penicillium cf. griseofulvum]KAJ5430772.1 hypothetical protein N7491_007788 [Penicillium cf. griseofulvum]KAJ5435458.1 hypothetical protein N7445_006343 [Penicillium cf. griseofulvum]
MPVGFITALVHFKGRSFKVTWHLLEYFVRIVAASYFRAQTISKQESRGLPVLAGASLEAPAKRPLICDLIP